MEFIKEIMKNGVSKSGTVNSRHLLALCDAYIAAEEGGFLGLRNAVAAWIKIEWQNIQEQAKIKK